MMSAYAQGMKTPHWRALGIMNGTSLDAIDYALLGADKNLEKLRLISHHQRRIPKDLRARLLAAAQNNLNVYELSLLHFDLGRLYAKQVSQLQKKVHFDLVGLHGQTVHHQGKVASLQIGHPAFLKQICQKPIFYDFRAADIALGGQGAPFAPFLHERLSRQLKKPCAFHNLGGISNLSYFYGQQTLAFDTGPANILLDAWVFHKKGLTFDKNGRLASQGIPHPDSVNQLLNHSYFRKKPPKSTGRELFNLSYIKSQTRRGFLRLSLADQMATLVEVTARSIANAYKILPKSPESIYFYGGGTANPYLMERLQYYLSPMEIKKTSDLGWPTQALEASVFALLALARHCNKDLHLPKVTGAKRATALGSVYF